MNPYPDLPWFVDARRDLRRLPARGTHAVLLYGARGIGKKSLALDVAADLLCESPGADGVRCAACSGCKLLAADNHPDLRVVVPDSLAAWRTVGNAEETDADSDGTEESAEAAEDKRDSAEIKIEQVRELADFFHLATHRAGWRVVVLAPANALNTASANAALKTLEEPPAATLFLLAADDIDDVLPTVRSRCVLFRVALPAAAAASAWLGAQGVSDATDRLAAAGGAPLAALAEAQDEAAAAVLPALHRLLERGAAVDLGEVASLRVPKAFAVHLAIRSFQRWGWDLLALRVGAALRYHPSRHVAVRQVVSQVSTDIALLEWQARLARLRREALHPGINSKTLIEDALIGYRQLFTAAG